MNERKSISKKLRDRLINIKALLMDVDGVLTDGSIVYSSNGIETKIFDVKDGYGITLARESNIIPGIITGRTSDVVVRRSQELGITDVYQNVRDKKTTYEEFKSRYGLKDEEIAYIGDDVLDLSVLKIVGFSAAPKDAHASVKLAVHYVTKLKGGRGAVREIIDLILSAKNQN